MGVIVKGMCCKQRPHKQEFLQIITANLCPSGIPLLDKLDKESPSFCSSSAFVSEEEEGEEMGELFEDMITSPSFSSELSSLTWEDDSFSLLKSILCKRIFEFSAVQFFKLIELFIMMCNLNTIQTKSSKLKSLAS
ncbi:predicted protein [Uncinocarpus reesii 1704]|uniref:Uncharacterized protein n=1 Tax=Uncinocarpus reesii (strain UAMH 1704) TaxID=336963 RepID=C4JWS0_UNCRE|nr:uncharacterized protein UREG_07012 [Uncinocarpus reesii 1704]EEP82147.1 predicted protein [Uncinocarpus reesii 1704]